MTRLKLGILSTLILLPIAVLVGFGSFYLWSMGWSFYAWFPLMASFMLAYLLAWYWMKQQVNIVIKSTPIEGMPKHWTDRDRRAWQTVEAFIKTIKPLTTAESDNPERYAADAQALAMSLVKLERPTATDPFGHLTIPEVLTCCELVAQEMHDVTVQYIPGSHLIRIDDLKFARKAVDWYQNGRTVYWAASAVVNPIKTMTQFVASKIGLTSPFEEMRKSALQWFYATYLKELGRYLIELNSGRLKVGAKRYREMMKDDRLDDMGVTPEKSSAPVRPIHIAIVGQVKAGKSSLVNALLGEAKANVAVTPETSGATKYVLSHEGSPPIVLVDSAGYGQAEIHERDVAAAMELAKQSDILILVSHARSAARKADLDFIDRLKTEFDKNRSLILPPIVFCLTHIDLLTPAIEWQPPYDWEHGDRVKEKSIRESTLAARETFGPRISTIVPVCTAAGKEFGVHDHLLTAILHKLGEARGVAIVRMLEAEAQSRKLSRIGDQIVTVGRKLFQTIQANVKP